MWGTSSHVVRTGPSAPPTSPNGRDSVVTRNKRDFIQIVSVWRWVYIEILVDEAVVLFFFLSNSKVLSVS